MSTKIASLWESIRASYWFVPSLLFFMAIIAAVVMVRLDIALEGRIPRDAWWVYTGGPDGARAVLQVIAGSMINVTSVVFSITIVALTLASAQFGPRLLRNFMRDTANQIVLGTFVSTFIYSLLVLRNVRAVEDEEFVPFLSVTIGVLLVITSIIVLIFFIHHIASSIQATQVVAGVARELNQSIDRLFPKPMGHVPPEEIEPEADDRLRELEDNSTQAFVDRDGYIQAIDSQRLMRLAEKNNVLIQLLMRPGDFAIEGNPVARVCPSERVAQDLQDAVQSTFVLGNNRTPVQDAEYGILQLVEVAVRSLSTGVNDPFTANNCLDRLGAALCRLATRPLPSAYRYDDHGNLRIIADTTSFAGFLDAAFNQIRQNATDSPAVIMRLMETIARVAGNVSKPDQMAALHRHALMVRSLGQSTLAGTDLADIERRYAMVERALSGLETNVGT